MSVKPKTPKKAFLEPIRAFEEEQAVARVRNRIEGNAKLDEALAVLAELGARLTRCEQRLDVLDPDGIVGLPTARVYAACARAGAEDRRWAVALRAGDPVERTALTKRLKPPKREKK